MPKPKIIVARRMTRAGARTRAVQTRAGAAASAAAGATAVTIRRSRRALQRIREGHLDPADAFLLSYHAMNTGIETQLYTIGRDDPENDSLFPRPLLFVVSASCWGSATEKTLLEECGLVPHHIGRVAKIPTYSGYSHCCVYKGAPELDIHGNKVLLRVDYPDDKTFRLYMNMLMTATRWILSHSPSESDEIHVQFPLDALRNPELANLIEWFRLWYVHGIMIFTKTVPNVGSVVLAQYTHNPEMNQEELNRYMSTINQYRTVTGLSAT